MYECLCDHFHAFRVMLCLPADLDDGTATQHHHDDDAAAED
jgi:hypothetical protein